MIIYAEMARVKSRSIGLFLFTEHFQWRRPLEWTRQDYQTIRYSADCRLFYSVHCRLYRGIIFLTKKCLRKSFQNIPFAPFINISFAPVMFQKIYTAVT